MRLGVLAPDSSTTHDIEKGGLPTGVHYGAGNLQSERVQCSTKIWEVVFSFDIAGLRENRGVNLTGAGNKQTNLYATEICAQRKLSSDSEPSKPVALFCFALNMSRVR